MTANKTAQLKLLREKQHRLDTTQLLRYAPYEYQSEFHGEGAGCAQRILMAANRVGKTYCGAAETAYHLTGDYPSWWSGRKFNKPVRVWAAGESNDTTRDIIQSELFGNPQDPSKKGTGAVPLSRIAETTRKPGVPNAFSSVLVKHKAGGNSHISFKAYEQGFEKFMGEAVDVVWLDEEPKQEIFSQCITRTADTNGVVYMTFTPERGMTNVVSGFLNDLKPGQSLTTATWDDVEHLNEDTKKQLLAVYSPAEREMRSKGVPVFGSGLVYPVSEDDIICDDFDLPDHYAKLAGIDFGFDHPTAISWIALDPVYMLAEHFKNPPVDGALNGNNSVEAGISILLQRMETGRLYIFKSCVSTFEEMRLYHRKNGKVVPIKDDLLSAMRYGALSIERFGEKSKSKTLYRKYGFEKEIEYSNIGIV